MPRPYHYLINSFDVVSQGSYRSCNQLCNFTLDAINSAASGDREPFISIQSSLQPSVQNFNAAYNAWKNTIGDRKSETTVLQNLFTELAGPQIEDWMFAVQGTYRKNTPQFEAIFPNGKKPFQTGKQLEKLDAVEQLSTKLGTYGVPLESAKTLVDDFLTQLSAAYHGQKETKADTRNDSTAVDEARITVCQELYSAMGLLMAHFKTNPEQAGNYFDLQLLRNREQTSFTSNIDGGETLLALTHTFEPEEDLRLTNKGTTPLRFALCAEANDAMGEPFVEVPAGEDVVTAIEHLGNATEQRFLKVQNMNEAEEGRYTIMLL